MSAWEAKSLQDSYLKNWLKNTSCELSRLEQTAAPVGWECQWDRYGILHLLYYIYNDTKFEISINIFILIITNVFPLKLPKLLYTVYVFTQHKYYKYDTIFFLFVLKIVTILSYVAFFSTSSINMQCRITSIEKTHFSLFGHVDRASFFFL